MLAFLKQPQVRLAVAAVLMLLTGFGVGTLFGRSTNSFACSTFRNYDSGYEFIAPLLFIGVDEEQSYPKYGSLKDAMDTFVERATTKGTVEDISFYFRDMNTSQWVAINPDERFAPASMLKVATLMATLDAVENDQALFKKRVRVGSLGDATEPQDLYPPQNPIKVGNSYTVEELLNHLTRESDNLANIALASVAGSDRLARVYDELQITPPSEGKEEGYTAREYSRLYRTLYNSTYLSRPLSEYALSLLSDTAFTQGIVSGVPSGTQVAHKFGVHTVISDPGTASQATHNELHDCGIVYYPDAPYFICVMTRGKDFADLERVLSGASKVVWDAISELPAEN